MSVSGKFQRIIKNVLSCVVVDMPYGMWNRMMERGPGESSIISHGDALVFKKSRWNFFYLSAAVTDSLGLVYFSGKAFEGNHY